MHLLFNMEDFEVSFNMNDYVTVDTSNNMSETFETEGKLLSEY